MFADCPTTVLISPASGPYRAGDVLTCKSDGFPESSYTWTESNGTVVSTASTTTWRQGWPTLMCTVTVNTSKTPCSLSRTVSTTGGRLKSSVACHRCCCIERENWIIVITIN